MLKNCSAWTTACLVAGAGFFGISRQPAGGSEAETHYVVDHVPEEWLPQNSVFSITQTHDGYLWLGTHDGLVRFDGVQCKVFNEANMPELPSSPIVFLQEDSRSNLWVGTQTAGIIVINRNGTVKHVVIDRAHPTGPLIAMFEDRSGALWLNTAEGRVARYLDNQVQVLLDIQARPILAENSGLLWLGVGQHLLALTMVANTNLFAVQQDLPVSKLDWLLPSSTGGFWRLADGRVQKWSHGSLERDLGTYPWGNAQVNAACEDRDGNLVVGTQDKGAFWFNSRGVATQISSKDGLTHDTIMSLCVDREGDLWVGTDSGGLNRVRPKLFNIQQDSLGRTIQSVCEDRQGGIWFANFGGKLSHWNGHAVAQYDVGTNPNNPYVRTVFVDRNRVLWVGTTFEGLFMKNGESFEHIPGSESRGPVSVLFEDHSGRLWIGTQGGLLCRQGNDWKLFTTRDGLSANDVRALTEDADGALWIGTGGGGLSCLRGAKISTLHKDSGLPSESVTALFLDRDGVLWVGTAAGLARLEKRGSSGYAVQRVFLGNSIGYMIDDDQGYLWIGSNAGLMRVPRKSLDDLAAGATNSIVPRVYGRADGLPKRECTQGSQPAACRTPDGKLWFCTIRALVSVIPADLKPNPFKPPVLIESVRVDGQEQNTNILSSGSLQSVVVPARKERLEIEYTSLNLAAPDRARFQYRLEGHEAAWTDAESTRVARYSNLPPGHYRFHVVACNEDGVWNRTGAWLAVTVLPPFWRTWWFLGANAALILLLLVFGVRYVSTQKLQRQLAALRQQEALEKERARIARDLHDQLGANLTQVSILGEMAASDKNIPHEVEAHAQQISQTARETTGALDEIVWAVNPSNDTLEGLIMYACKYAQDYFTLAGVRHRLDVPTQLPHIGIPPELRHNVFLAFKEAVNNVVKHAQASEARIRLVLEKTEFTIEIEDNGRGPGNALEKQGRNGLRNMRKRMEDVGGAFSIDAANGGGTRVRLIVPIAKR